MGGGSIFNKVDLFNIPQEQKENNNHSLYPTYNPEDFRINPIPLTMPQLPPIPEAYRQSRKEEEDIVDLIYTKSGFYSKGVHGFFTIFSKSMEDGNISLAWIPEYLIDLNDIDRFIQFDGELAFDHECPDIHLNTAETISLEDVYSMSLMPPFPQRQGSIVIILKSGDSLEPMNYISEDRWPGYNIADILSVFTSFKSIGNFLYLVGSEEEDVIEQTETRESASHALDQVSVAAPAIQLLTSAYPEQPLSETAAPELPPRQRRYRNIRTARPTSFSTDPLVDSIRDVQWTLLERLSKITHYSRQTATQILEHPIARPVLPLLPSQLHHFLSNEEPQQQNDTRRFLNEDLSKLLADAPELQGPAPIHNRGRPPVSAQEWTCLFDSEGKLLVTEWVVRKMVFSGGLSAEIRPEAWGFLLGIFPWQSTADEREAIRQSQNEAYYRIKGVWFNDPKVQKTSEFEDEKHRIQKDVQRTDRTHEAFVEENNNPKMETMKDILLSYNFHNTNLGYVQGMSDLLAPLLVVMDDEPMAFWAFAHFMNRVQTNFYMDQSGMHAQLKTLNCLIEFMDPVLYKRFQEIEITDLFFCFRWLLVWFKREFEWDDVLQLWEVLWTDWLTDKMVLFIVLAVIDTHRDKIMNELNQFDETLRYINDLSGHIDLKSTLERAEVLYYQFENKSRAMQHKSNQLKTRLEERSVWNSPERQRLQTDIEKLQIPNQLIKVLPKNYIL
ncbi:hypothetical protein RO3G_05764 [Rhizopus delemar RA 99-880]|uniref:Rab-GAP TBC domain-containing protein n=1 Tax=Rhizopus delemar (strain RA 99-880 / ATCC MYA-4621 / FGSC 9543 / NRRL 43880) TaxID=246409 RepID=I1BXX9_RHIO9|nr:hypothetical protein RO3G_05764 [Rhizopus delemar RA 99-880]|eukprot:EIE81059.1 hypothetical protein RO3G_05764 [Rhizopus delemar RA 99-880]